MCVFFAEISTAHHHNVVLHRSLSHTHMTGQQWLPGQVVPYFSGFANIFDPKGGSQEFFDRQGVTYIRKRFPDL